MSAVCSAPKKGHKTGSKEAFECPSCGPIARVSAAARAVVMPPSIAAQLSPLEQIFSLSGGSGDEAAEIREEFFTVCDVLRIMGEEIPETAEYVAGLDEPQRDDLDWPASEVMESVDRGEITADELRTHLTRLIAETADMRARGAFDEEG